MHNKKEIMDIIEDGYPIEPSGSTRADQLAREIGATGEQRSEYQKLFIELIEEIPNHEWSFVFRFMVFAERAKFEKAFYEAFASFIKDRFSEADFEDKEFCRGRCIEFVATAYKDLFDFQWITATSPALINSDIPWPYLDMVKMYEPENFLFAMNEILERLSHNEKDLSSEIVNYAIQLTSLFPRKTLIPYFEKWKAHMPQKNRGRYVKLISYYLNKESLT